VTQRCLAYTITDPSRPGGVEAVFQGVMAACRDSGLPVTELRADDCPLYLRPGTRRRLHLPSALRLFALLARHRPTVVNVHFITAETWYFALFRRLFGYRLILSFHGSDLLLPDPQTAELLPAILARADACTVVSRHMLGALEAVSGVDMKNVHLVFNGIDPDFWHPSPEPKKPGKTMLCAGRLEPVKGFDLLIESFARISRALPDLRLVIVGDGSQRAELEQQASAAGLQDRITFTGFLDRDGLRAEYHKADLFVMPSRSEGFPIALLEAMATGLPFVAADVGGVTEIATEATGVCIPPENVSALSDALLRVFRDFDLQTAGHSARERASEFSVAKAERRYVALISGTGRLSSEPLNA